MKTPRIGIIGFGEVGATFAQAMDARSADLFAYDVLLHEEGGEAVLHRRVKSDRVRFSPLAQVLKDSEIILSTVTTQVAVQVAQACAPYLSAGQVFIDLNSTSPAVKKEIAAVITETGANFIEGAILGAVGASGPATRIFLTGSRASELAALLNEFGLNCAEFGSQVGDASSFKMLRSIFSKGMEALLIETLTAGMKAGISAELWDDLVGFMTKNPFDRVASNWIQTHATAYERRYHEMVQVVKTVEELGLHPIMSEATRSLFERSINLGFDQAFKQKPENVEQVLSFIVNQLDSHNNVC